MIDYLRVVLRKLKIYPEQHENQQSLNDLRTLTEDARQRLRILEQRQDLKRRYHV